MRVSLLVGATLYPLAGEDGVDERVHSSAAAFEIAAAAEVQELQRVRAAQSVFVDRGNLLTTVTFSTTRLFDTPAEAELFILDYDGATPRAGTLVLEEFGAGYHLTYLLDALIDPPARRTIGCTAILDYRATGSELES